VIKAIFDRDSWLEIKPTWARNLVIGLARVGGESVGVVANQPLQKGGILDVDAADKAAAHGVQRVASTVLFVETTHARPRIAD